MEEYSASDLMDKIMAGQHTGAKEVFNSKFISNWVFDIEIFLRLQSNGHNLKESTLEIPLKTRCKIHLL